MRPSQWRPPHILDHGIGPGHADHAIAAGLIGIAERREHRTLAGPGLTGHEGKSTGPGRVLEGGPLLGIQARVPGDGAGQNTVSQPMTLISSQQRRVLERSLFGRENRLRCIAGDRRVCRFAQADYIRQSENLVRERGAVRRIKEHLREHPVEIRAAEGRALLGQGVQNPWRTLCPHRRAQFALFFPPRSFGSEVDDFSRRSIPLACYTFALGIMGTCRPVAVAEIGRVAFTLHPRGHGSQMHRCFPVEPLIDEAPAIDADVEPGLL